MAQVRLGVIVPSVNTVVEAWYPHSHPIIEALEARIGKPVVTSTQAILWHVLRLAGVARPDPRLWAPVARALAPHWV